MATGAQAVEKIAAATGVPIVTVDRAARVLKQHKPNLWSRSGLGGGSKAVPPQLSHLVNLGLALHADPITSAASTITTLRG